MWIDHSLVWTGHFDLVGSSGASLRTHISHIEDKTDWENKCRYAMKDGVCIVRLKQMPPAVSNKRKHGDDDAARGEPWSLALLESCETADSPEEAVFSMKNQFAHIWIDKYDKLLDAAVRFSFRLRG
jgi:hypothetical protein